MNETTIEPIWQAHHASLHGFILSRVEDAAAADDILQEVFLNHYLRKDLEVGSPDYEIDATVGGPVPGLNQLLGDLRFQASYRRTQTAFAFAGNARDAFQESFIKCWRHRQTIPEIRNLKSWIFRIALNTGRDLRQQAWRRRRRPLPEDPSMLETAESNPHATAEQQEQLSRLRSALRDLRPEEQEVFLLRQNGELTYDEIAEAIGIPTGTVKTRMRLALSKLRVVLAPA